MCKENKLKYRSKQDTIKYYATYTARILTINISTQNPPYETQFVTTINTATCFGSGVPSSGKILEQTIQVKSLHPVLNRPQRND